MTDHLLIVISLTPFVKIIRYLLIHRCEPLSLSFIAPPSLLKLVLTSLCLKLVAPLIALNV